MIQPLRHYVYQVNSDWNGKIFAFYRMVDINPFELAGINKKNLAFIQLFLVWLAGTDQS